MEANGSGTRRTCPYNLRPRGDRTHNDDHRHPKTATPRQTRRAAPRKTRSGRNPRAGDGPKEEEETATGAPAEGDRGGQSGESVRCAICLDTETSGAFESAVPCAHSFHSNCLATWLRSNGNCPLCRSPVESAPRQQQQRSRGEHDGPPRRERIFISFSIFL